MPLPRPVAQHVAGEHHAAVAPHGRERLVAVEVERGPDGAGQWPLVLAAPLEFLARVADVELDPRSAIKSLVIALEKVIEKALLEIAPIGGVEVGPVGVAVGLEPLLIRNRLDESAEVSPRVDPLTPPSWQQTGLERSPP